MPRIFEQVLHGRFLDLLAGIHHNDALRRLRHDAEVAVADPTTSTEDVQGQPATCTSIPVDGSTNTYCVLDNGVLGRMEAGDLVITMTAYEPGADASLFTEGGD